MQSLRPNGCQGGLFLAGSDEFVAAQYVMVDEIAAVVVAVVVEVVVVTTGVQLVHDRTIRCAEVERGVAGLSAHAHRCHNTMFWTTASGTSMHTKACAEVGRSGLSRRRSDGGSQ